MATNDAYVAWIGSGLQAPMTTGYTIYSMHDGVNTSFTDICQNWASQPDTSTYNMWNQFLAALNLIGWISRLTHHGICKYIPSPITTTITTVINSHTTTITELLSYYGVTSGSYFLLIQLQKLLHLLSQHHPQLQYSAIQLRM